MSTVLPSLSACLPCFLPSFIRLVYFLFYRPVCLSACHLSFVLFTLYLTVLPFCLRACHSAHCLPSVTRLVNFVSSVLLSCLATCHGVFPLQFVLSTFCLTVLSVCRLSVVLYIFCLPVLAPCCCCHAAFRLSIVWFTFCLSIVWFTFWLSSCLPLCLVLLHNGGFFNGCITKRILLIQTFHS
jgi:hypothetical protein